MLKQRWQLQEAKSKFSQLVAEAVQAGPQVITRRGVDTAVLISFADYQKMVVQQEKLSDFFRQSPLVGAELDLTRDPSPSRPDIEL